MIAKRLREEKVKSGHASRKKEDIGLGLAAPLAQRCVEWSELRETWEAWRTSSSTTPRDQAKCAWGLLETRAWHGAHENEAQRDKRAFGHLARRGFG